MTTVILVLHIVLAAAMIGMILVQRNEGGALGIGGGTFGGLMTSRGTANLLTRITAFLATSFFVTTLVLAVLFKGGQKTKSILDEDETKPAIEVPLAAEKPAEKTTNAVVPQAVAPQAKAGPVSPQKAQKNTKKQSKSGKKTTPVKTSQ